MSQIDEDKEGLKGADAAYKEAVSRPRANRKLPSARMYWPAFDAAQREIDELSERLKKFKDNLERTALRAPVPGVVKSIHVSTIGGDLKPGDTVVDIVPGEDKLIVEAQLPTQDIGYVQIGQEAILKLNAPAFSGPCDGNGGSYQPGQTHPGRRWAALLQSQDQSGANLLSP